MIPILTASQIKQADAYTIEHEPISSYDLMERASQAFVKQYLHLDAADTEEVHVFAGIGNNGGDALAIARILFLKGYKVSVFVVGNEANGTEDFKVNYEKFRLLDGIMRIDDVDQIPDLSNGVIIDGLFGSGLSRGVQGIYAQVIYRFNQSGRPIVSIDIASGLATDDERFDGAVVNPSCTISFHLPKLPFFQPDLQQSVGEWFMVDIGLDHDFIQAQSSKWHLTEKKDVQMKAKPLFGHKGTAGRVMLVAGSRGKMGAATLAGKAALRSGAGLVFIHSPHTGTAILQINVPEAMVVEDEHDEIITEILPDKNIDYLAIGPGIGTNELTCRALSDLLDRATNPMVLDADAINIVASHPDLIEKIPKESVLTPHPGEFQRLVGNWKHDYHKLELLSDFCSKHRLNTVLKGAYSVVCDIKGRLFFNPTGNPGMGTAGSGDVLTGVVLSLLGQGYSPFESLRNAVYIHGYAGDLAKSQKGEYGLIASDIIENLPNAILDCQRA